MSREAEQGASRYKVVSCARDVDQSPPAELTHLQLNESCFIYCRNRAVLNRRYSHGAYCHGALYIDFSKCSLSSEISSSCRDEEEIFILRTTVMRGRGNGGLQTFCWVPFRRSYLINAVNITGRNSSTYSQKHTRTKGEPIPETAANESPALQSLASRLELNDLPLSTLARTLISETSNLKYANNTGLAKFGKSLLSFHVYQHFMARYPRLPPAVLRHLVDTYTSLGALAKIGILWGVQPDTRSSLSRFLADTPDSQILGKLSFSDANNEIEPGVTEKKPISKNSIDFNGAMGMFVRALVAAIYAHRGLEATNKFIHEYLVRPRKIDVASLMAFSRPTRELSVLCAREGLEPPVSRLMAESGRYSNTPVFVVGVFSGARKLGEGQGASLREARTRSCVNALQGWYLYSPVNDVSSDSRTTYIDAGQVVI